MRRRNSDGADMEAPVAESKPMPDVEPEQTGKPPIVIKKYANRRLYNTATSAYVTLESLSDMVREGVDFTVQDAKTGEDITRAVLTQIIFEQESRGEALMPVQFLRRLIRYYGHSMQGFVPAYLDLSMESFSKSQDTWREQLSKTWSGARAPMGLGLFEETARQNMALFDRALKMWAPMAPSALSMPKKADAEPEGEESLTDMKRQLEAMQKQLDQLSKK
jgi:polyhydroxyalkanoate synthesis repressor PhaR